MRSAAKWYAMALAIVVIDQITKAIITSRFAYLEKIEITSFFNLVLAHNTGAAFSFLAGASGWQRWFFAAIALVVSLALTWFIFKHAHERWFSFSLTLILGGAVGNLIDRLRFGYVVDFVQLHAGGYYWPAFNVADSCITVGAIMLVIESLRKSGHKTEAQRL